MELSELICQISILVGTIEGLIGTQQVPACVLEMGGIGRICRGRSCRFVDYGLSFRDAAVRCGPVRRPLCPNPEPEPGAVRALRPNPEPLWGPVRFRSGSGLVPF